MSVLPMFPLGTVLVPSMVLPLRVFEPRYLTLVQHCIETTPEFGVVLIARGSEVGGGDVRHDVATVARIVGLRSRPDGGFHLQAIGARRVRVDEWLDDDPFPRAVVREFPDTALDPTVTDRHRENVVLLRRMLAMATELGDRTPPATVELSDDPVIGGYQAAVLAGLGPADLYSLLNEESALARAHSLARFLADQRLTLELRMRELGMAPPAGAGGSPLN
jgi:Lon protease-like protein